MKKWVFPLVFLIGWLSTVPCCDAAGHEERLVETCTAESQTEAEECSAELPCSPFYNCGTCVGCIYPKDFLFVLQPGSQPASILFFESTFKLPLGNLFLPLKPPKKFFQSA